MSPQTLKTRVAWNLAGALLPLFFGAVAIPVLLNQLGGDGFAVLLLVWALVGYLSLFELGLGKAITVNLSQAQAQSASGRPTNIANVDAPFGNNARSLVAVALGLAALAGAVGCLLTAALAPAMAQKWLQIAPAQQQSALWAFQWAALGVLPAALLSVQRGALEGTGQFGKSNALRIALGAASFGLPLLAWWLHGPAVWVMAAYIVVFRFVLVALAVFWVPFWPTLGSPLRSSGVRPIPPGSMGLGEPWAPESRQTWRDQASRLLRFGGWLTVSSVVGPVMVYGDRFFVSAAVGAALLPLYAIPQEALQRLLVLPMAVVGAMLPGLAAAAPAERLAMYARHRQRFALLNWGICACAALLIHPVLSLWLGADFAEKTTAIALLLCVGIAFNAQAQLPFTLLHAAGNSRITALSHLIQLPVYLALLFAMAQQWGLLGAALAWVCRAAADWLMLHLAWSRTHRATSP